MSLRGNKEKEAWLAVPVRVGVRVLSHLCVR